jgi:sterol desaturase/sphingolipid hydroxylase (fatty acid hydroxylase superfamily)
MRFFFAYIIFQVINYNLVQALPTDSSLPLLLHYGFQLSKYFAVILLSFILSDFVWKTLDPGAFKTVRRFKLNSLDKDLFSMFYFIAPVVKDNIFIVFTFGVILIVGDNLTAFVPPEMNLYRQLSMEEVSPIIVIIGYLFFTSFFSYWNHRFWHNPVLWPIHRYHHSATELNFITAFRNHPSEKLFHPVFKMLPLIIFGFPTETALTLGILIVFHEYTQHSGGEVSWGFIGRWILCDPLVHKIHHSKERMHFDKNYGSITPIWDRLFGTWEYDYKSGFAVGVNNCDERYMKNPLSVVLGDFSDFLTNLKSLFSRAVGVVRKRHD